MDKTEAVAKFRRPGLTGEQKEHYLAVSYLKENRDLVKTSAGMPYDPYRVNLPGTGCRWIQARRYD